jgi:hypothetical protein
LPVPPLRDLRVGLGVYVSASDRHVPLLLDLEPEDNRSSAL